MDLYDKKNINIAIEKNNIDLKAIIKNFKKDYREVKKKY